MRVPRAPRRHLSIQVGTGGSANDTIDMTLGTHYRAVGTLSDPAAAAGFECQPSAAAQATITAIDTAIARSPLSAQTWVQPRTAWSTPRRPSRSPARTCRPPQSRITDTDMAQEMVKFTKANILAQAGTAMLAQANQSGQGVLSLLR